MDALLEKFKLGPLNIDIKAPGSWIPLFKNEFEIRDVGTPDLVIELFESEAQSSFTPTHYAGKETLSFNENTIRVNTNAFYAYELQDAFSKDNITHLRIFIKKTGLLRSLFRILKQTLSVQYSNKKKFIIGQVFTYECIWSVIALCLLKKDAAFIHAGIVENAGKAIVMSGTGGCGKTSGIINFVESKNCNYLSEDFGIVSQEGTTYYCQKSISLYDSDVAFGVEIGKDSLSRLSLINKLKWKFLTKILSINPIIKVNPAYYVSEIKVGESKVGVAIYLTRQNIDRISVEDLTSKEFARRSALASMRELKPFVEILKLVNANSPDDFQHWDDSELQQFLIRMFESAFGNLNCYKVKIPLRVKPDAVTDEVLELI